MTLIPPRTGRSGDSWVATLVVDRSSPTPAYLQLQAQLERVIHGGQLEPGSPLPSERGLAEALGLSRMTIRRAYEALVEAGEVEQRRGAGTFVRARALEASIERLSSFSEEVVRAGYEPSSTLITIEQFPAGEAVAQALEVEPGTVILRILRLRSADGKPLELQDAYLPPQFLSLSIVDLTQTGSLYRSLDAQFGVRPLRTHQTVGARLATQSERRYLKLTRDVPVLSKRRITYGLDERPIEYVLSAVRSDKYRLVFEVDR